MRGGLEFAAIPHETALGAAHLAGEPEGFAAACRADRTQAVVGQGIWRFVINDQARTAPPRLGCALFLGHHRFLGPCQKRPALEATVGFEPTNKGFAKPLPCHLATSPEYAVIVPAGKRFSRLIYDGLSSGVQPKGRSSSKALNGLAGVDSGGG